MKTSLLAFALLFASLCNPSPAKADDDSVVVDFVDCVGGKIALGAGFASYHCYTTTAGRGGFTNFKERHYFGGGQLGFSPLVGYKGAAFYNPKTGSHCVMYGMAVGYEADLSAGMLTIIDSGESYL